MNNIPQNDLDRLKDLLRLWQRKQRFLEREQAISASASIQFELQERIKEYQEKIRELQKRISEGNTFGNWQQDYSLPPEICQNQAELKERSKECE